MALLRAFAVSVHSLGISQLISRGSCKQQQHTEASTASLISSNSSNLPNYPRQLVGSYKALMHLLNCKKRDSPAVDAATSTVSSEPVPVIISAVAASASSADATPHVHVSPKFADPLCDWTSRSIRNKTLWQELSWCW